MGLDVRDIVENMVDSFGLTKFAAAPFINRSCQQAVIKTIKRLMMDPYFNRLSQMIPIFLCLKCCGSVLQSNDYSEDGKVVEADRLSVLRDQVAQLAAIFSSKICIAHESHELFRMQSIYKPPIIIGHFGESLPKLFVYSYQSVCEFNADLTPLLEYFDSSIQSPLSNKKGISSSKMTLIEEELFLLLTLNYCKEKSAKKLFFPTIYLDLEGNIGRHENDSLIRPERLSGIMLAYLINAIPMKDRSSCISSVVFKLGSNLQKSINNVNFESDNDKNVSSILVELVYNIFSACSIYVNVFQYSKNTDKNDRNVNEKHKVSTNDFALDECHELLSWSFSLAFSNKNFTKKSSQFRINPSEKDKSINQDCNLSLLNTISTNSGLNANEDGIHYSIFQSALFQFIISNIFNENDEMKRDEFISVLGEKSSNYLNLNLTNNLNFYDGNNNKNSKNLSNCMEAFHEVVGSVLYPLNLAHQSAIISLSEYHSNSKLFFSFYCLQCCFIFYFCSIIDESKNFNKMKTDNCGNDQNYTDNKVDDNYNNNDNNDHDNSNNDNNNSKENKEYNDNLNRIIIPMYTTNNQSSKANIKNCTNLRLKRGTAFTFIVTSAKKILPRDPELFLRILCDSLSCSIAIEIEKKIKFMETKNGNNNSKEHFSPEDSSQEDSFKDDSTEVIPQFNIIEQMVYLLFDIADELGINISTILSCVLKNEKFDPLREIIGIPKEMTKIPNSKTVPTLLRMSCEFGSGFLTSIIFLFSLVDSRRCQEVSFFFSLNFFDFFFTEFLYYFTIEDFC